MLKDGMKCARDLPDDHSEIVEFDLARWDIETSASSKNAHVNWVNTSNASYKVSMPNYILP